MPSDDSSPAERLHFLTEHSGRTAADHSDIRAAQPCERIGEWQEDN